jgi:6-phosphogluconate dehydrogenase
MQLGMIGLGRMGGNIVRRLLRTGHACVVYDRNPELAQHLAIEDAFAAASVEDMVAAMEGPRHVRVRRLSELLRPGDVLIDGGNSFYKDDIARARQLAAKGLHYIDVGTSGGIWGRQRGYCMMIGGDKEIVDRLDPIFSALATGSGDIPCTPGRERHDPRVQRGYLHAGSYGAGHFVKMIHNGIEYGLMQAYAEGMTNRPMVRNAPERGLPPPHRRIHALEQGEGPGYMSGCVR